MLHPSESRPSRPISSRQGQPIVKVVSISTDQPGMWLSGKNGLIPIATMDDNYLQRAYWYAEKQNLFHNNHASNPKAEYYTNLFHRKLKELEDEAHARGLVLTSLDEQVAMGDFLSNTRITRYKYCNGKFLTAGDYRRGLLWRDFTNLADDVKDRLRPYMTLVDTETLITSLAR